MFSGLKFAIRSPSKIPGFALSISARRATRVDPLIALRTE